MNQTMRNFVTFIAFVACIALFASCDSKPGETNMDHKEKASAPTLKKKPALSHEDVEDDTLSMLDSIAKTDSLNADSSVISSLPDSVITPLPLPDDEVEVEWESAEAQNDTLSAGSDEEVTEEWLDESGGEDEGEYIDYSNSDVRLNNERLLKTEIIKVKTPDFQDEKDSLLAVIDERMSLNRDQISKQIVVEKWFSPVNYRGYKFNRKKLMLYGVDKETLVSIYFYLGEYYFAFNQKLYNLDESARNISFERVQDPDITSYLLKYEN